MTVQELCKRIEIQENIAEKVNVFISSYNFKEIETILQDLIKSDTAKSAYGKLMDIFVEDEDRIKMLSCYLMSVSRVYDIYQEMGISDEIFTDTFKCFTRFIKECKVKTGKYAFDRAFWTYRQASMVLFRIGELEYEMIEEKGKREIAVHIPSDARMTDADINDSLKAAQEFFATYYPKYSDSDYVCDSWLLSPKLKELLGEESNIIRFQNRFEIISEDKEAKDIFEWLFKTSEDADITTLPEDTSLQRKAKALLLQGDNIGIAVGVIKK